LTMHAGRLLEVLESDEDQEEGQDEDDATVKSESEDGYDSVEASPPLPVRPSSQPKPTFSPSEYPPAPVSPPDSSLDPAALAALVRARILASRASRLTSSQTEPEPPMTTSPNNVFTSSPPKRDIVSPSRRKSTSAKPTEFIRKLARSTLKGDEGIKSGMPAKANLTAIFKRGREAGGDRQGREKRRKGESDEEEDDWKEKEDGSEEEEDDSEEDEDEDEDEETIDVLCSG